MALPSQAGAGSKIKRRDGKGRRANGDEDKVENEAKHWRSFPARRGYVQEYFCKHAIMTAAACSDCSQFFAEPTAPSPGNAPDEPRGFEYRR
jgi:hypothetical protein